MLLSSCALTSRYAVDAKARTFVTLGFLDIPWCIFPILKYHTWLDPRTSLEELSAQLMEEGAGVKSVAWEHPKRERN